MILNGGLYKNENELRLSMSRIKEYKEWKKITEYEYSIIYSNPLFNIQLNNIVASVTYLDILNSITKHKWNVRDNYYYADYDEKLVNDLCEIKKDYNTLYTLLSSIYKINSLNSNINHQIKNDLMMNYVNKIEIIKGFNEETEKKYNIVVDLVNDSISIYSCAIRPNEKIEMSCSDIEIDIKSKSINKIILKHLYYNEQILDIDMFKRVLKNNIKCANKNITKVLYVIIELIDKFYSSSLFDIHSNSRITNENINLCEKYTYYRFKTFIESEIFVIYDVNTNYIKFNDKIYHPNSDGYYIIPYGIFTIRLLPANKNDCKFKMITCIADKDNDINKVNECILHYNENDMLSNNKPKEYFQEIYYNKLKDSFKNAHVYNELYNDIDIFRNKQPLIDWFKNTYGTRRDELKKDSPFKQYIIRFISRLIYQTIKYNSDHICSIECKNTSDLDFKTDRCKGIYHKSYYPTCKIELIINTDNNVNLEFIKSKLIEYHKQCEINDEVPIDTSSRIKIKLIKDFDLTTFIDVLQSYRE